MLKAHLCPLEVTVQRAPERKDEEAKGVCTLGNRRSSEAVGLSLAWLTGRGEISGRLQESWFWTSALKRRGGSEVDR